MRTKRVRRAGFALALALVVVGVVGTAGTATAGLPNVAICATQASSYDLDVHSKLLASGAFSSVDLVDCRSATPSLATLQGYANVLAYSDGSFANSAALGDVLADYVDGGGRLVVATFSFYTGSYGVGGRLVSDGYLPFTKGSQTQNTEMTLVADLPGNPLLAGVTSFDGGSSSYHNSGITTTPGTTLVAHWSGDGLPLVAFKGNVVGLNFYPPSSDARDDFWDASTDGVQLLVNALGGTLVGGAAVPSPRGGYCTVAGNVSPYSGKAYAPGTFVDLTLGQADTDPAYKGAVPANHLQGIGISCDVPAGYVKTDQKVGYAPGEPGIYPYYRKA